MISEFEQGVAGDCYVSVRKAVLLQLRGISQYVPLQRMRRRRLTDMWLALTGEHFLHCSVKCELVFQLERVMSPRIVRPQH